MSLEEFSRRQRRNRIAAIREHIEKRRTSLSEATGSLSDRDKIQSESYKRVLRAKGANGAEA